MNGDTYFLVLELLSAQGVNRNTDISDELRIYFSDQNNFGSVVWIDLHDGIEGYLKQMQEANHIKYVNNTKSGIIIGVNYLPEINVTASLTAQGLVFLQEKKQLDINQELFVITRRNINLTLIIAVFGLFIGLVNLIKDVIDNDDKQHIQELKKQQTDQNLEILKLQSLLHQQEIEIVDEIKKEVAPKKKR